MKKKHLLTAFLLVTAVFAVFAGGQKETDTPKEQTAPKEPIKSGTGNSLSVINPEKVATVNDSFISMKDLETETSRYLLQYERQGQKISEEQITRLKIQVLQTLINQKLMLLEFEKSGMAFDPAAVDKEIENIRSQFSSEEEFLAGIEAQGFTKAALVTSITEQVKIQTVLDDVVKDTKLEENEAREYYNANPQDFASPEMVRAAHILIKTENTFTEAQKAEALERIKAIKADLDNGADFAETAKAKSEGPTNVKGGDLGFFAKGQMVKPFEDVAWTLEKNQISDIVETQFGYHIIKKIDTREASKVAYEDVFPQLSQQLLQFKQQKVFEKFLLDLREKSSIEVLLPELKME